LTVGCETFKTGAEMPNPSRIHPVFRGIHDSQHLVFCVVFVGFLLDIVLSVLLWFMASNFPFGIFKLFF
jgi:hypothetical protein